MNTNSNELDNNQGESNQSYDDSEKDFTSPPPYESKALANDGSAAYKNPELNSDIRPVSSMTANEIKQEKIRIWKNVTVISLSFMCLFTAYNSVANLQSSINNIDGLGTWSQATVYASLIISSMFVPTWLIKTIKCKWTLVVSQLCYSAYICAQFHATFATLIPAAVLVGLGGAPLWSAKCTYLTKAGNRYAALINEKSSEQYITRFFSVFFMIFQTSQVWGNLISSLVLSSDTTNKTLYSDERLDYCGANFCSNVDLTNITGDDGTIIEKPAVELVQLLTGILLGFALLATVIIIVFVDSNNSFEDTDSKGTGNPSAKLFVATFKQMKNPYQILIIPLTLWSGFEQAEYTASFISCSWGVEKVGYVLICYGAADAIGSIACEPLIKLIGRVPIAIFGAILNLALILTMLLWRPNPTEPVVYFVIAALWGLADAIWHIQLNSFYGFIFRDVEEAAFSNCRLWTSLGFCIAFAYSAFLCTDVKLYVLLGILFCGMAGYLTIEVTEKKKSEWEKKPIA